jgi:hypothetical protein
VKLAEAYAPDLVPVSNPLDDYIWTNKPTLMSGLDYHDDTVYITVPASKNVQKMVGRGKQAVLKDRIENHTICVTSAGEWFEFTEDEVLRRGFKFSPTFMQDPDESPWPMPDVRKWIEQDTESPDPFALWSEIRQIYVDHIEFAEERMYDFMAVWVMMTYVFRIYQSTPYVHFNGTMNAGKSQNMRILNAIALNPVWQSSMSPSALFRTIGSTTGTVLIDECETWKTESQQELLQILKSGNTEGSKVRRVERSSDDKFQPVSFAAYSPKVFASINPLDDTMQSRCIIINMRPAMRKIPSFIDKDERWPDLRNRLYLFAMYHTTTLTAIAKEWDDTKRHALAPLIQNRQWQMALPILSLADYIAGKTLVEPLVEWLTNYWAEQVRNAAVTDRQALLLRVLPRVIATKVHQGNDWYTLKDIHTTMLEYLDEDQHEHYKTRTIIRALPPLGLPDKRNRGGGLQIKLPEEMIRTAIHQRRIEPFDEDVEWLAGNVSYVTAPPLPASSQLWTLGDEDEDTS